MDDVKSNDSRGRNRAPYWLFGMPLFFCLVGYLVWGSTANPAFTIGNLGGLNPDQVIAQLGPPVADDRTVNAWTPAKEPQLGALVFTYHDRYRWRGYEYSVVFRNNRVSQVLIGTK